jgi:pyruvate,water dikinase
MAGLGEWAQFQKGEILVARQTDPGWASLFFLASGLIMERGGMLSHGAIVAREFGIPAVIAVPQATDLLQTGEMLLIDGDQGRVLREGVAT